MQRINHEQRTLNKREAREIHREITPDGAGIGKTDGANEPLIGPNGDYAITEAETRVRQNLHGMEIRLDRTAN